ncbi:LEM3/CDC50 family protein [Gregarina niphandrodes]|uniref:LEM3/CDC50 family protein n=1 Tax=Gregarina niphandrodes TaxID=110365 RepID=A0A023AYJ2_GRENI|nr:LEM3/CDC50 family protein [Gregarina niphandrodes]EZG43503.1 LEM3/CDC50 family protein [Gregarina niphandrodes]|eukprot:XP_011133266.1 LEM3/CDC50 family protein [Gregarina niphandrodes]
MSTVKQALPTIVVTQSELDHFALRRYRRRQFMFQQQIFEHYMRPSNAFRRYNGCRFVAVLGAALILTGLLIRNMSQSTLVMAEYRVGQSEVIFNVSKQLQGPFGVYVYLNNFYSNVRQYIDANPEYFSADHTCESVTTAAEVWDIRSKESFPEFSNSTNPEAPFYPCGRQSATFFNDYFSIHQLVCREEYCPSGPGSPSAKKASPSAKKASPDGVSSEGVSPEGVSPDGVSPEGVSPDGVSPDGVSPDGVSPDGVALDHWQLGTEVAGEAVSARKVYAPDGEREVYLVSSSEQPASEPSETGLDDELTGLGDEYSQIGGAGLGRTGLKAVDGDLTCCIKGEEEVMITDQIAPTQWFPLFSVQPRKDQWTDIITNNRLQAWYYKPFLNNRAVLLGILSNYYLSPANYLITFTQNVWPAHTFRTRKQIAVATFGPLGSEQSFLSALAISWGCGCLLIAVIFHWAVRRNIVFQTGTMADVPPEDIQNQWIQHAKAWRNY